MLPYLVQNGSPIFILDQVISYGVDVRKYSEEYFEYGLSYEKIRYLLEHGADPNVKKSGEWPLLFWVLDNYDTLKVVLEKGADVNVKYETDTVNMDGLDFKRVNQNAGMYMLDRMKSHFSPEDFRKTMNLLLDYGLDINYKEEMGRNLRDYARRFKYDLER